MKDINTLRHELADTEAELDDLYMMSDEAACFRYNTDTKEDAITAIREWIEGLIDQLEKAEEEEEMERARDAKPEYHFAFASERDYWDYKGF